MKILVILVGMMLASCTSLIPKPDSEDLEVYVLQTPGPIGITAAGQAIKYGGLSSLHFLRKTSEKLSFQAITDRGPNAEEFASLIGVGRNVRPFLLPDFAPELIDLDLDRSKQTLVTTKERSFYNKSGRTLSGRPPENPKTNKRSAKGPFEIPVDLKGNRIPGDSEGMDSEGFCQMTLDGKSMAFVSEEYGPDILQFEENFKLIKRWKPGLGLPKDLLERKLNRGFEGLACVEGYVFALLQSPLKSGLEKDQDHIRLLKFDPRKGATEREYFYPLKKDGPDKLGDMAYVKDQIFLIIEQNGKLGRDSGVRNIYKVNLSKANSKGQLTKDLVVDLNSLGFDYVEKIEGIAVIDSHTIAVVTDNDFGLGGQVDLLTGKVPMKQDTKSYLAIVKLNQPL